ncbi:hypothetical protein ACFWB0_03535 [Rhodococcus sp. NPDC060086]|uniref:hypothetical protein n=1 Tax=Rhodococcus sp. NPDC060086 TaxID=3347055 RepID=UPI00365C18FF
MRRARTVAKPVPASSLPPSPGEHAGAVGHRAAGHVRLDEVGAERVGGLASVLGVSGSDPDRLARLNEFARDLVAEALLPPAGVRR